jgi:hypothetical protein
MKCLNLNRRNLTKAVAMVGGLLLIQTLITSDAFAAARRFYLTKTTFDGDHPLTACEPGFHMASLWEIFDTTVLEYDTSLGQTQADSGSGPPNGLDSHDGWIRTGAGSNTGDAPGVSNCSAWTSLSSSQFGTFAFLPYDWNSTAVHAINPWVPGQRTCNNVARVWCVQDLKDDINNNDLQVRYATNLNNSDSIFDVTNTGANSTVAFPQNGNICANVYGISNGQLLACCSCLLAPDRLASLSVQRDLLANNNFPPNSLVIKLIATAGTTSASSCDASKVGTAGHPIVPGMAAWGTVSQPLSQFSQTSNATETPFTPSFLSTAELANLKASCVPANGAGSICNSCR